MQISKNSWHFRFNNKIQGYSFTYRALERRFTTCSYIRTTIRSVLQSGMYAVFFLALALGALFVGFCMGYIPFCWLTGLPIIKGLIVPCVMGWTWLLAAMVGFLFHVYGEAWSSKLSDRKQKKLNLLEQRLRDGKNGICTLVEVV